VHADTQQSDFIPVVLQLQLALAGHGCLPFKWVVEIPILDYHEHLVHILGRINVVWLGGGGHGGVEMGCCGSGHLLYNGRRLRCCGVTYKIEVFVVM
jgi:hypothetical protein